MERPRGVNCIKAGGGLKMVYISSRKRTVRLGSLQGLYERFPIRNLIRYSPPTQAGLYTYRVGPLKHYFLQGVEVYRGKTVDTKGLFFSSWTHGSKFVTY